MAVTVQQGLQLTRRPGRLIQARSDNVAANVTTTATAPVYATLFTVALTLTRVSDLKISMYAAWLHNGGGIGNAAANFRFRRNGVLLPVSRGTTDNALANRITATPFERLIEDVPVGLQTIICEWSRFGAAGATLRISAASLPDLQGAHMTVENWLPS